jgi:3-phenylpropionate/trans-cinnamate dioxygenase ferredoxin reductase subunit
MTNYHERTADLTSTERIVIVGASLAGLRAAEALRNQGFTGHLTLIGDEADEPYDRPPLSKAVLREKIPADHTTLPRFRNISAEWLLGVPAVALDRQKRQVQLADGRRIDFDRLLITTGTRARPWPDQKQAALDGVYTLRTRQDAARLSKRLKTRPKRVLVIGAGFTGSEIASVCRERDIPVTVAERSATPLSGALGQAAGAIMAQWQRQAGVDLRCNVTVMALEGDKQGNLCHAHLSDNDIIDIDIAVVALGAVRNVEWLQGSGLAADARGVVCDASCRVFDSDGIVTDDIFVAGDVARWPHVHYGGEFLEVEHWGNAVQQAATAAHNMVCAPTERQAHKLLPSFWSNQFGVNLKLVGLPTIADSIVLTQGSVSERRCLAVYGHNGRIVAALAINNPRWLSYYQEMIEQNATFPPPLYGADQPMGTNPIPAGFPPRGQATHSSGATVAGPGPATPEKPVEEKTADPRIPTVPLPL